MKGNVKHVLKAIASGIIWGLGQVFNRQYIKALFFFVFFVIFVGIELGTGRYFEVYNPYIKLEESTGEKFSDTEAQNFVDTVIAKRTDREFQSRINTFYDDFMADYEAKSVDGYTMDELIQYTAKDISKSSPEKYYDLLTYLNEGSIFKERESDIVPGDEILNNFVSVNLYQKTYYNTLTKKEYIQSVKEDSTIYYVNVLDSNDTTVSVQDLVVLERTNKLYRYNNKFYAQTTNTAENILKYVNITDYADQINKDNPEQSAIIKDVEKGLIKLGGYVRYDNTNKRVYVYYNPEATGIGYNATPFSTTLADFWALRYGSPGSQYNNDNYTRFLMDVYFAINDEARLSFESEFNNFFHDQTGFFVKGLWSIITLGETNSVTYTQTKLLANALSTTNTKKLEIEPLEIVEIRGHMSSFLLLKGLISTLLLAYFVFIWIWAIRDAYKTSKRNDFAREWLATGDNTLPEGYLHAPTIEKDKVWFKSVYAHGFEYIVLLPAIFTITFISLMPILFGFLVAFTSYSGYTADAGLIDWVGFTNFASIFSFGNTGAATLPFGTVFWKVLWWTMVWAVASTATVFFGGFFQALIINNDHVPLKKVWRTVLILPWAIPAILSQMMFGLIFEETGILNNFLQTIGAYDLFESWGILGRAFNAETMTWFQRTFYLGHDNIQWFMNANNVWFVRITIIVINIWLGFPYYMALMSGIMTSIDKSLYEAADIDGASGGQKLRRITFPLVMYSTAPLLVMCFSGNFNNFGIIYFMTEGGQHVGDLSTAYAGDTDILISWMYRLTVDYKVYNMASVFSILIFIIVGSIAAWNYSRTKAFKED